jgi:ribosome-binding protein aMBF1 (putative translation factor)
MSPQSDEALKLRANLASAFGRVLWQARTAAGHTRLALALEADLDSSCIEKLERAMQCPSLQVLISLAGALELEPEELLRRTVAQWRKPTGPASSPSRGYSRRNGGARRRDSR